MKTADLMFMLFGALTMLLLCGSLLLWFISRTGWGSSFSKSKLKFCSMVARLQFTMFLLNVAWLIQSFLGWTDIDWVCQLYDISCLCTLPPFVYGVGYVLRFGKIPSPVGIIPFMIPWAIPIWYYFCHNSLLYTASVIYFLVAIAFQLLGYYVWFRKHRSMWDEYDADSRVKYVHQIWTIVVPMMLQFIVFVLPGTGMTVVYSCIYYAVAYVLWLFVDWNTLNYMVVLAPTDEEQQKEPSLVTSIVQSVAVRVQPAQPEPKPAANEFLSPRMKGYIAEKMHQAEEEMIYLQPDAGIQEYVRYVGTNRTYLSYYVNNVLGCSFSIYLNDLRMKYIKGLMDAGERNAEVLSEKCGYSDMGTFRRNFKRYFGEPVNTYMAKL